MAVKIDKYLCSTCKQEFDTEEEANDHHAFPKRIKMYLNGSKDSNWGKATDMSLDKDEEFMEKFRYTLYEVEFELEVNRDGSSTIVAVNGKKFVAGNNEH